MTLDNLIARARAVAIHGNTDAAVLANSILDILAEDAPCGWEAPRVTHEEPFKESGYVHLPSSWDVSVTPDDARALARLLLHAADEADAKGKP